MVERVRGLLVEGCWDAIGKVLLMLWLGLERVGRLIAVLSCRLTRVALAVFLELMMVDTSSNSAR